VTGSLDVDATIEGVSAGVTSDNVNGTARVTLESSTIGGLAIDRAILDGDYRDRSGEIRQLEVAGRDLNAKASGTLTLEATGESKLAFEADSSRLEELGKLVNVPVSGLGRIEGTVTGNRAALRADGTLTGSGVKYGDTGALALSAVYSARVPDLEVARAEVTAETKATFVTVAGQEINELTAKTTYAGQHLEFDATAQQRQRSLSAAGSMVLHPDHREVHLQRMTLETQGLSWQMVPGSQAAVQYADEAIVVRGLDLVSGDQRISADGTFGRPGDALKITMRNVDLAAVDALLLRPPQFKGRVDATGVLRGTRQALQGNAEFQVNKGSFRMFQYETFAGTVDYKGQGLTIDTRLQQNATQWLTAKGYVPRALFTPRESALAPSSASHDNVVAPEDRVDLTIDSSPIDLGVIQGFNDIVTDVKGTLEAHVRVTGSVADPHPIGEISVRDGSMTVVPAGVQYKNIAGRIELQPDRVHIDQITVLDNHDSALSVTGDLATHERQIGDMHIYVTADDFKIMDNKLGNARIHSRMEVAGELRAPRLEGYLGLTTGQINVDELIDLAGPTPYATEPASYGGAAPAPASEAPSTDSLFDRLRLNVELSVPNDLVVKAGSLELPDAPIGLGALTVTLGGDLQVSKDPGGRMRLVGAVNTIRGSYDFQGRRFEILRDGSIRFDGLDDLDPALDIRARRIIQAVEARVNVRGTLKKPEIVLSSVPPLDQADILSLIVFNQPINMLGEGQQISLVQRAQALATGAVAGQIAMSIGRALNLDTFAIDVAPEGGGGPALTVGQQIGQDLYVKVEQGIGEQGSTNFILEYELTEWLRLQANVLQGSTTQQSIFRRVQGSGADLIFFFSF
jgi:translocation and assembly module TamB